MDESTAMTRMVVGYVVRSGQVLLGLRKEVSWGLGKNLISGIGGKVGDKPEIKDETADEALEREFQEEVSAKPIRYKRTGHLTFLFPNKPKWNQAVDMYIIDSLDREPMETEQIKPLWYSLNAIPFEQMWDDSKYYLADALAGAHIDATFTYGLDNRTVVQKSIRVTGAN